MRVLVTGHHGYIGSITARALHEAGHDVVGLDTLFYDGCDLDGDDTALPTLRLDVRDVGRYQLKGFDAIVHLAALSNDPLGDLLPRLTRSINYDATIALARAAKQVGVTRFVFASSCSMYGVTDSDRPVDERTPLAPVTEYAHSKARSEEGLRVLADRHFSPVYMRNGTAYGVSPRMRVDLVLNNLVAWAHTTVTIRILSDGTPWRPLVHVNDIAAATLGLLEAPRELVHNEAFNIGAPGQNYQVRQIADIVRDTVDGCEVEIAGASASDARSYRVDFSKFARVFPEFSFRWTVHEGARELLDAYRRAGLTLEEFQGPKFTRVEHLKRLLDGGTLNADLRWGRPVADLERSRER